MELSRLITKDFDMNPSRDNLGNWDRKKESTMKSKGMSSMFNPWMYTNLKPSYSFIGRYTLLRFWKVQTILRLVRPTSL